MLQWLRTCPWDEAVCLHSALKGHLEVLQWAREQGCPWDEWTCSCATAEGHLEVLQWASERLSVG